MKRQEYFLYAKKIKITTFFVSTISLLSVSPCQRSAILDITQLYLPQSKDVYSPCIYALIWMKTAHPCIEAAAEECTLLAFDG